MNVTQIHEGRSIFTLAWASIGIMIESHSRPIIDAHHLTMYKDKQSQKNPPIAKACTRPSALKKVFLAPRTRRLA